MHGGQCGISSIYFNHLYKSKNLYFPATIQAIATKFGGMTLGPVWTPSALENSIFLKSKMMHGQCFKN